MMYRHAWGRFLASLFLVSVVLAHPASGDEKEAYRATSDRRFANVEHWERIFDDPERAEWQKPDAIVNALGIGPGMRVADVGAGTGFMIPFLSKAVGAAGTVFAVEVEPNLVTHLRERAEKEHTANVVPVLASLDNPRLPQTSLDAALFVDAYHHVDQRREYLKKVAAALKPGGRIAVVEWKPGELPVGPKEEDHKLPEALVLKELGAAGFERVPTALALPHQYFVIFSRPSVKTPSP